MTECVRVVDKIRECAAILGVDLDVDPDEIRLQVASAEARLERLPVYSTMANGLNLTMIDDAARARYREIWGEDWQEVPPMAGEEFDDVTASGLLEQDSSTRITIPSSPRARRSP